MAIQVPMLVSQSCVDCPLLGLNVLEELIRENSEQTDGVNLSALLNDEMNVKEKAVETMVSAIKVMTHEEMSLSCRRHKATGYSQFFLLYGRVPRFPIDLLFNLEPETVTRTQQTFAEKWATKLQDVVLVQQQEVNGKEDLPVRRSTCTGRPREMFSNESLGQPSYQSWRQGANSVVLNSYMMPGNMMTYLVLQGGYWHEGTPIVWTC
ncbi:unnamed protein product [Oncorhynchus mykiss]|uniref:Uncharacterized protein n=1 Tax=Oncorhynchus mykiss TaxID=8022 RepID=A0A060YQ02_ONCMY|nr:unnamed protein product [Oncorhynchus mykiss]